VSTFLENTGGANGMAFDAKGRLLATHVPWGGTKVSVIYPKGSEAVLVDGEYLLAFDVQPDGSLRNRRNFARYEGVTKNASGVTVSGADGITIDGEGRLYVATSVGVQVFSAQGQHLGTIPLSRAPQNLAFAGPDKKTLYVVGRGAAFKIEMLAQGFKDRAK